MKFGKTILAAALLASTTGVAFAGHLANNQSNNNSAVNNAPWYVDGNIGLSSDGRSLKDATQDVANASSFLGGDGSADGKNYGLGVNANVGKMLNKNFGVEAGYSYLPGTNITASTPFGSNFFTSTNNVIDVAVKGVYDFDGSDFNVFGKLGPAYVMNKVTSLGFPDETANTLALYFGAGFGYDITENLTTNIAISGVSNSNSGPNATKFANGTNMSATPYLMLLSWGMGYQFG